MKDEELVTVPVPRSRLTEVYALLGSEPPAEPKADDVVIERAVQESPPDTKRFLELLAASPGEWLSIEEVRKALGRDVHELAGVLSTLPRRWRGRYGQSARLPFEVEGQGSERRYRMEQEVAEVVMKTPPPTTWNLENFTEATRKEGGDAAVAVLRYGLDWAESHGGDHDFESSRPYAPLYFRVPDRDGEQIRVLTFRSGRSGVLYKYLKVHPAFAGEAERREFTKRLNGLGGPRFPHERWEGKHKAFDVKLEFLRIPEFREAFFRAYDYVPERLLIPPTELEAVTGAAV